jgi:hypothetical protein
VSTPLKKALQQMVSFAAKALFQRLHPTPYTVPANPLPRALTNPQDPSAFSNYLGTFYQ